MQRSSKKKARPQITLNSFISIFLFQMNIQLHYVEAQVQLYRGRKREGAELEGDGKGEERGERKNKDRGDSKRETRI
jgi:hypothetical protein